MHHSVDISGTYPRATISHRISPLPSDVKEFDLSKDSAGDVFTTKLDEVRKGMNNFLVRQLFSDTENVREGLINWYLDSYKECWKKGVFKSTDEDLRALVWENNLQVKYYDGRHFLYVTMEVPRSGQPKLILRHAGVDLGTCNSQDYQEKLKEKINNYTIKIIGVLVSSLLTKT